MFVYLNCGNQFRTGREQTYRGQLSLAGLRGGEEATDHLEM
ncbi:hypothetical protein Mpsy_1490 [Methanolobus psychrophilus R15]|nr:hypothetical protein Mpsy_1490 [Methanolobus psychrophilus R15]